MKTNIIDIPEKKQKIFVLIVLLFLFINLVSYIHKMPLFHEEPRRVIVAQEMLLTGNYIVPKVYQKPYWKKPPFQNWMIALLSLPKGKVTDYSARLVSILSFLILGVFVYQLLVNYDKNMAFTAFLVITTNYLMMCEYGNKAEPDILFTTLIFISYYFYIKKPNRLRNIIISSIFMGASILTKGISPLFFYPGLFVYYVFVKKFERKQSLIFLFIHFILSLLLPLIWLILYYFQGDLNILLKVFNSEIGLRTQGSITQFLTHFIYYPIKIWIVLLPWSLVLILAFKKNEIKNEVYQTSLILFLSSLIMLTLTPGARDRYLMPAFPFFAILVSHHINLRHIVFQKISRSIILLYILLFINGIGFFLYKGFYVQSVIFFFISLILGFYAKKNFRLLPFILIITCAFLIAYEHGLYFYRSQIKYDYKKPAKKFAAIIDTDIPVIVDDRISPIQFVAYLEGFTRKPVYSSVVLKPRIHYLLTTQERKLENGKEIFRMVYNKEKINILICQYIEKR